MKTAQMEVQRINQEIEAKMGGAPLGVTPPVETTTPPIPPATPPQGEIPKQAESSSPPPVQPTPLPVDAEPKAPPPAQSAPAPPALPAKAPPPEPKKDYKELYEIDQARKVKQANAYKNMQTLWQQSGNRVAELEEEVSLLRSDASYTHPAEPAQLAPAEPPEKNEAVEKYLVQQREDYGPEYVDAHESFIRDVAAEAVKTAVADVHAGYENIQGQLDETRRQQTLEQNGIFESELSAQHADWEEIIKDDGFKTWVLEHPHGEMYMSMLWPRGNQFSATSGETAHILDLYKQETPKYQDQAAQNLETNRRLQAAAASDQGDIHTIPPEIQAEGEYILLSDIPKMQRKLGNNPKALMEFNAKVEVALAAGMIVNDNFNSPFQGGVVP